MTRVNTLKDIEKIYEATTMQEGPFATVIEENTKVKASKEPKPNKGFEEDTKDATSPSKKSGPKAAAGYEEKVVEAGGTGKRDDKNQFSAGKVAKESINISKGKQSMAKPKSIFDKLYEDVLGGDEDMGGFEDLGAEDSLGDEEIGGEEELDEVTLTLPRDLAEKLHEVLMDQMGGDEDIEDIEDIDGEDEGFGDLGEGGDDEYMQEAPDVEVIGHALQGDIDKGNLKGKSNKVSGSGPAHSSTSGDGDGKLKGGNPEPTDLGDKSGALTGKNNKVGGKVKGKDQELFAG